MLLHPVLPEHSDAGERNTFTLPIKRRDKANCIKAHFTIITAHFTFITAHYGYPYTLAIVNFIKNIWLLSNRI